MNDVARVDAFGRAFHNFQIGLPCQDININDMVLGSFGHSDGAGRVEILLSDDM